MEIFDIVNENDEVIGKASRDECHKKGHVHRSVLFFIMDDKKRVFVNKRSSTKDFYPGYWSIVLGGHVSSGDTYDETVKREVKEEAGIDGAPIYLTSFKKRFDEEDKENIKVYTFYTNEKLTLDKNEIIRGQFMTINEIEEKLKMEKFIPETNKLFHILKKY